MLNRRWPHGLSTWNWVRNAGEGPNDNEPFGLSFLKHCVSAAGLNLSCGCLMSLGKAEMRLRWWHKNLNYAPAAGEYWQRCNVTWPHWPGPHTTQPTFSGPAKYYSDHVAAFLLTPQVLLMARVSRYGLSDNVTISTVYIIPTLQC